MVSHIEVILPEKPQTPNNIDEALKGHQRQIWKESLLVKYDNSKRFNLLSDIVTIKYVPDGTKVLRSIISTSIKKGNCYDSWKVLYSTVQIGFIRFKLLILIGPTLQWHILTTSESTLLSQIFIDLIPVFGISVIIFIIQIYP